MSHLISVLNEMSCRGKQHYEVVVAANPATRDLLFGLDAQPLGLSPLFWMPGITLRHWYGTCHHSANEIFGSSPIVGIC